MTKNDTIYPNSLKQFNRYETIQYNRLHYEIIHINHSKNVLVCI